MKNIIAPKKNTTNFNFAVLIDGDITPSAYVNEMMEEIAKYGYSYYQKNLWRLDNSTPLKIKI